MSVFVSVLAIVGRLRVAVFLSAHNSRVGHLFEPKTARVFEPAQPLEPHGSILRLCANWIDDIV